MKSLLEWRLAARNLKRNPRRTLSTGIALVVAYVGVALLAGHVIKSEKALRAYSVYVNRAGHVSVYKKGGVDNFETQPDRFAVTEDELAKLNTTLAFAKGEIEKTGMFLSTVGLMTGGERTIPVVIEGLEPEVETFAFGHPYVREFAPELDEHRSERTLPEAVKAVRDSISISRGVGELLGRPGPVDLMPPEQRDLVIAGRTIEGDLNAVNATLAVRHTTALPFVEDTSVIAPISLVRDLMGTSGASHVSIFLNENSRPAAEAFAARLQKKLDDAGLELQALPFTDDRIGLFYTGTMKFLFVMVGFFGALIFGASALILVNSLTMSLMERSREMGTLRAFGYTPERVRGLFVRESAFLALAACVVGIALSEIIASVIGRMGITFESAGLLYPLRLQLLIEPWFHACAALVLIAIAALCSAWIMSKSTKQRISVLLLESGSVI